MDKRIAALYAQVDPEGIVRSAPGVGQVGAPQIAGRLGDATRFANLAAVRSFAGLVPHQDASGVAARAGGPTKAGDACLREALFIAADHARKIDPTPAARYHQLFVENRKHHNSAVCTLAGVLLTRDAIVRLVGAVLAEQTDEWAEGRRYLGLDILARCRLNLIDDHGNEVTTSEPQPALTA